MANLQDLLFGKSKLKRQILILLLMLTGPSTWGAVVKQVKNNKMLIDLEGQIVNADEIYFLLDENQKKRAIVKIKQVKGDKAVAELLKGKAYESLTLSSTPYGGSQESSPPKSQSHYESTESEYDGNSWGVLGTIMQNSMNVSFIPQGDTQTYSAAMTGTSFGALGFYDYPLLPDFQLRAMGGLEQFNANGPTSGNFCAGGTNCGASITYLSLYGGGKFNVVMDRKYRWWIGGFYGFLIAMAKSSNVLSTGDIQTNQVFSFAGGYDYVLSKRTYVPISIEYGLFPSTSSVTANIIYIRAGWATLF